MRAMMRIKALVPTDAKRASKMFRENVTSALTTLMSEKSMNTFGYAFNAQIQVFKAEFSYIF